MATARYVPGTVRLCQNVNEAFQAIVEIAKKLNIDLSREVTSVVNGILTIGGMLVGGFTGGPRGVVSGGLAGAQLANTVMNNDNFIKLADYLLNKLPNSLKESLVDLFSIILAPFRNVEDAVQRITSSSPMAGQFKGVMELFLAQYDNSYHVSS